MLSILVWLNEPKRRSVLIVLFVLVAIYLFVPWHIQKCMIWTIVIAAAAVSLIIFMKERGWAWCKKQLVKIVKKNKSSRAKVKVDKKDKASAEKKTVKKESAGWPMRNVVTATVIVAIVGICFIVYALNRNCEALTKNTETSLSDSSKKQIWVYPDRWTLLPTTSMINLWIAPADKDETFLIKRVSINSDGKEVPVDLEPYENSVPQPPKFCAKIYLKASQAKGNIKNGILILYENR